MNKNILSILIATLFATSLDSYECCSYPGGCYYDCRQSACLVTGILIGTAVIAGLVAIVVHESNCSHSH